VGGTRAAPQIGFNVRGSDIRAAALANAGVSSLGVRAEGTTDGTLLNVNTEVSSPDGLRANVNGNVPLNGGELGLDVNLQSFPLALLNRQVPNQNLGGTLTGTAKVAGRLEDPNVQFNIQGSGLTALQLSEFGASPLSLDVAGSFAKNTVQLLSLTANGPSGLTLTANGAIPIEGAGLAVNARGSVPLALANRILIDRGTQLSGTATVDIQASGSIGNPVVNGTISTNGASVVDPLTNLRLNNLRVDAG